MAKVFPFSTLWQQKKLKDLCLYSGEYGLNSPAIPLSASFPLYIRITDIDDNGEYLSNHRVSVNYSGKQKLLQKHDILFARTGATVGKSYLHRNISCPTAFAGYLIRFIPNTTKIIPYFLFLYCHTSYYWNWIKIFKARSGQPGISANEYEKMLIPCPPIEEQQKIVEVLETWDKAIQLTRKLIEQKELQKKYLMQQLLTGHTRLKGFVTPWKTERLGHFKSIIIEKGTALSSQNIEKGPIPVIAGGQTVPYYHKYWTHDVPCITISASGAYAGFVWLHSGKIWASDCSVIYTRGYDLNFLYYCLKSQQNHLFYLQTGGAQAHIYPSEIRSLKIPNISLQEQQAIVQILNINFQEIDLLRQKLAKLEEQKKGLMQVLLTGKMRLKVGK